MTKVLWMLAWATLVVGSELASAQTAATTTLSKDQWIRHMKTTVPLFFCQKKSALRVCFSVSAQECEEDMASATRLCVGQIADELPDSISSPQGQAFGSSVGECAANAYAALHTSDERNTEECKVAIAEQEAEISEMLKEPQQNAHGAKDDKSTASQSGEVLYTLVNQSELGKYWKIESQPAKEPDYPMALRGSRTFCAAVGFAIDTNGIPASVATLHASDMSSGIQKKLKVAVESYVKDLRFTPVTPGPSGVPVFTYVVLGRYSYMHGTPDGEKNSLGSQAAAYCDGVAKTAMANLHSRSR